MLCATFCIIVPDFVNLVNFYISIKMRKMRYLCKSSTDRHKIYVGLITQNVSLVWLTVKNFNFRIAIWRTAYIWKISKLQYLMMMQNGSLKCISRPPSWIFKIKLSMGGALETRSASSCQILWRPVELLQRYRYFSRFQLKCKNSLDDHTSYGLCITCQPGCFVFRLFRLASAIYLLGIFESKAIYHIQHKLKILSL